MSFHGRVREDKVGLDAVEFSHQTNWQSGIELGVTKWQPSDNWNPQSSQPLSQYVFQTLTVFNGSISLRVFAIVVSSNSYATQAVQDSGVQQVREHSIET